MRATVHRLRGVRGLITGWALIGITDAQKDGLRDRIDEDRVLLGRLDWIREALRVEPEVKTLARGEAPQVLLAAALGFGTPEEAHNAIPHTRVPVAGLALALWVHMATNGKAADTELRVQLDTYNSELTAQLPNQVDNFRQIAAWSICYHDLLYATATAQQVRFRRGLFVHPTRFTEVASFSARRKYEQPAYVAADY